MIKHTSTFQTNINKEMQRNRCVVLLQQLMKRYLMFQRCVIVLRCAKCCVRLTCAWLRYDISFSMPSPCFLLYSSRFFAIIHRSALRAVLRCCAKRCVSLACAWLRYDISLLYAFSPLSISSISSCSFLFSAFWIPFLYPFSLIFSSFCSFVIWCCYNNKMKVFGASMF